MDPAKTPTPPTDTPAKPTNPDPAAKSLLNQKDEAKPAPAGAPDKYEPFTPPADWADKGWELDATIVEKATPILKELGLSQAQAQKLIDFYTTTSAATHEASMQAVIDQNADWVRQVQSDPEIGGAKLNTVKTTISKAIDGLGDPKLSASFREAMDLTGVGNHPAFIKAFYKMAQKLTEGSHVAGGKPSELGQRAPGSRPASAAAAMYPTLP